MITDERVQALAFEVAFARDWDCTIEKRHDLKDLIASALTTALEEDLRQLTKALEEERAKLETAIRCLPSVVSYHGELPYSENGIFQVRLEAVCALVRNGAA